MPEKKKEHNEYRVLFLGCRAAEHKRIIDAFQRRPNVEVLFADSKEQAFAALKEHNLDTVFIHHSPALNGIEFFRTAHLAENRVPTVLLIPRDDPKTVVQAYEKGVTECVVMHDGYPASLPDIFDRALARLRRQQIATATAWAISQSRAEWIKIIDAITDYIFITDEDCKLVKMNVAFSSVFGSAHPRTLIGATCAGIFGEFTLCLGCQKNNRTQKASTVETKLNGNMYQVSTFPLSIEKKQFTIHVLKDITETMKLKDQLYFSDKLASLGSLVAGVAHEINNPLTGVIAYTELLRMKYPNGDMDSELKKILDNAERCKKIVENLLTFSRQKAPARSIESINDIIDRAIELRTYWLRSGNIKIIREYGESIAVYVDAQQMQLVMLNILLNAEQAIAATRRGSGTIAIKTAYDKAARRVTISIADDGPGIPQDVLPKVFDPFFTTKSVGVGTGLGLAIAHGIITEHGGGIWAESTESTGTRLVMEIPTGAPMG